MIDEFVAAFEQHKEDVQKDLLAILIERDSAYSYWNSISGESIVKILAKYLPDADPERVTTIDYGDYQGTQVFVLGCEGYQPYKHWVVAFGYGSCSGCDAIKSACDDEDISDLMMIALHLVQGLKQV